MNLIVYAFRKSAHRVANKYLSSSNLTSHVHKKIRTREKEKQSHIAEGNTMKYIYQEINPFLTQ
jgi:hypothetical protein